MRWWSNSFPRFSRGIMSCISLTDHKAMRSLLDMLSKCLFFALTFLRYCYEDDCTKEDPLVANCQHLQIVNIFPTTISTTNHPLLYNHYIYASPSHVDRRQKRDERRHRDSASVCRERKTVQLWEWVQVQIWEKRV